MDIFPLTNKKTWGSLLENWPRNLERCKSSCQANKVIIHSIIQRLSIRTVITKKMMEPFLLEILTSQCFHRLFGASTTFSNPYVEDHLLSNGSGTWQI